jgi:hypothetical protein
MPTVVLADGFHVRVYNPPREHSPAHVHVLKGGGEVLVNLNPIAVRKNYGMRAADIVAAVQLVEVHQSLLLAEWRKRHG